MLKKLHLLVVLGTISIFHVKAQLFSQDFNSSSALADYVDATSPGTTKFNAVSTTNANTATAQITNNALKLSRTATTSGVVRAARTTDLAGSPVGLLLIKFRLAVAGNNVAKASAATFWVGNNFTTNASADAEASGRLSISFENTPGEFSLRTFKPISSSDKFIGPQNIAWYLNDTGNTTTYTAPDGSVKSVANNTSDVWVGNQQVFDDTPQEGDFSLTDFKFIFDGGSAQPLAVGDILLDDLVITDLSAPLAVTLSSFSVKNTAQGIQVDWKTASEQNNAYFELYRWAEGKAPQLIDKQNGNGTANTPKSYSYIDKMPPAETVFYQLKQVDFDGKSTLSHVIYAKSAWVANSFSLSGDAQNATLNFNINSQTAGEAILILTDVLGRKLATKHILLPKGQLVYTIELQPKKQLVVAQLKLKGQILVQKVMH